MQSQKNETFTKCIRQIKPKRNVHIYTTYGYKDDKLISAEQILIFIYLDSSHGIENYRVKLYLDESGKTQINTVFKIDYGLEGAKKWVSDTVDNSGLFQIARKSHTAYFPDGDFPHSESLLFHTETTLANPFALQPSLSVNITNNFDITNAKSEFEEGIFSSFIRNVGDRSYFPCLISLLLGGRNFAIFCFDKELVLNCGENIQVRDILTTRLGSVDYHKLLEGKNIYEQENLRFSICDGNF